MAVLSLLLNSVHQIAESVACQLRVGDAAEEVGVHGVAVLVEDPGEDRRVIAARSHLQPP